MSHVLHLPRPALVAFDAYGTLFDLTSVLRQALADKGPRASEERLF